MNRTLLVSAFLAIALTACGKKEPAPAPAAAKPADAAAPATTDKKTEQKN
jgi:predicted small lipoprotein YifL